jgi:hypothetical protein
MEAPAPRLGCNRYTFFSGPEHMAVGAFDALWRVEPHAIPVAACKTIPLPISEGSYCRLLDIPLFNYTVDCDLDHSWMAFAMSTAANLSKAAPALRELDRGWRLVQFLGTKQAASLIDHLTLLKLVLRLFHKEYIQGLRSLRVQ